jgi:uncharacterized protein (TIGR02996 family)
MSGVKVGKMTDDELGLLRAILAEPPEDMHRLRYADWLEEHAGEVECRNTGCERGRIWTGMDGMKWIPCPDCSGSGRVPDSRRERAEFIRVQVELANPRWPDHAERCGRDCAPECPHWDYSFRLGTLRRRERELSWGHGRHWLPACLGSPGAMDTATGEWCHPGGVKSLFRRGFVESVACPAAAWLEHGDALYWRPGQTEECFVCGGSSVIDSGGTLPWGEPAMDDCPNCDKGRVPRPCPPTAQPVTRVRLTTRPDFQLFGRPERNEMILAELNGRYPGVTFELPETVPA